VSERRFWVWTRIRESNVWDPPHFPLLGTLIWLLIEAKKQQRPKGKGRQIVMKDGSALRLEAGQVTVNQRDMATELMVHHTTIGRRLRQLEKFGICAPTHAQRCTVVTILNWDSYQPEWAASAPTRAPATHQRRTSDAPSVEKERKRERETHYPRAFLAFWDAYPKKVGKGAALKAWRKGKPDLEAIRVALAWQRDSAQWQAWRYIPYPATYLNQERWKDEPPKRVEVEYFSAKDFDKQMRKEVGE